MKPAGSFLEPSKGHVLMISLLFGLAGALMVGIQQALSEARAVLRSDLKMQAFLAVAPTDQDATKLSRAIQSADPAIQAITYQSKEQAFQEASKDPLFSKSLLLLKENPLPASFTIRFNDDAWSDRSDPSQNLRSFHEIQDLQWDASARTVFRSLTQWLNWFKRLDLVAAGLLAIWLLFGVGGFLSRRCPVGVLLPQLAVGMAGGAIAVGVWSLALRHLGADAAAYRPAMFSILPLVIGGVVGIASFGWGEPVER